MMQLQTAQYNK